jgi:hypothetical protein
MTVDGVALFETSVVTFVFRPRIRDISFQAPGMDSSGWATKSIEGFSSECEPGLQDSMRAERVGVYDVMKSSEKYNL